MNKFNLISLLFITNITLAEKFEWKLYQYNQVTNSGVIHVFNENPIQILNETVITSMSNCNKKSQSLWNTKEITLRMKQEQNIFNANVNISFQKISHLQGKCMSEYVPFTLYEQSHQITFDKVQVNSIFIDKNTQFTLTVIP